MKSPDSSDLFRKKIGLPAALAVLVLVFVIPNPEGLSPAGWKTAGVALFMSILWITEAIPIPVTALMPLVLFPTLSIANVTQAASPYAHKLIFLFLGGFILAISMKKWNLHLRIALIILDRVGTKPAGIIAGFMIATAFLSMWVSNTATVLMMFPVGLSVIHMMEIKTDQEEVHQVKHFSLCLMLSIAYAANIGGIGTVIGTPPNAFLKGYLEKAIQFELGFGQWMMLGVPFAIVMLSVSYFILTKFLFHFKLSNLGDFKSFIVEKKNSLGKLEAEEKCTAIIGVLMAVFWMFRPLFNIKGLSDTVIAMAGAILLFVIPIHIKSWKTCLEWKDTKELPWDVLFLFGGGLSLASAFQTTGLSKYLGELTSNFSGLSVFVLVGIIVLMIIFLTEITSNTATTTTFLPVLGAVALGMDKSPLLFAVPAAMAASCAFMLPVATPPNAIVFGSGKVTIPQMARAGFWLNITAAILIPLAFFNTAKFVFGISF